MNNEGLTESVANLAGVTAAEVDALKARAPYGIPARRLGILPLARVLPQDAHSVLDYLCAAALVGAGMTGGSTAKLAGSITGGVAASMSLLTDYRLSVARVIPIEVHEVLDYVVAGAAMALPFALRYGRRGRVAALVHAAAGLTLLLGSLVTDYRAARGRGARLRA